MADPDLLQLTDMLAARARCGRVRIPDSGALRCFGG